MATSSSFVDRLRKKVRNPFHTMSSYFKGKIDIDTSSSCLQISADGPKHDDDASIISTSSKEHFPSLACNSGISTLEGSFCSKFGSVSMRSNSHFTKETGTDMIVYETESYETEPVKLATATKSLPSRFKSDFPIRNNNRYSPTVSLVSATVELPKVAYVDNVDLEPQNGPSKESLDENMEPKNAQRKFLPQVPHSCQSSRNMNAAVCNLVPKSTATKYQEGGDRSIISRSNSNPTKARGILLRRRSGSVDPSKDVPEELNSRYPRLEDFLTQKTIGRGNYGQVKLVQHKETGEAFALKIVKKSLLNKSKRIQHTLSEKSVLADIRHQNIVKLFSTFNNEKNIYFLFEWIPGGDLYNLHRKNLRFSVEVTKFYIASLVNAIEYMHSKGVMHRDLKLENLLLDDHGYLKIVDFGFSKQISCARTFSFCGTPAYLAPEMLSTEGHDFMVDWWALGVLVYELLAGFTPFTAAKGEMDLVRNVCKARYKFPKFFDADSRSLIEGLLTIDSTERLGSRGAHQVRNHPWFNGFDWEALSVRKLSAPFFRRIRRDSKHLFESITESRSNSFDSEAANDDVGKVPELSLKEIQEQLANF